MQDFIIDTGIRASSTIAPAFGPYPGAAPGFEYQGATADEISVLPWDF